MEELIICQVVLFLAVLPPLGPVIGAGRRYRPLEEAWLRSARGRVPIIIHTTLIPVIFATLQVSCPMIKPTPVTRILIESLRFSTNARKYIHCCTVHSVVSCFSSPIKVSGDNYSARLHQRSVRVSLLPIRP